MRLSHRAAQAPWLASSFCCRNACTSWVSSRDSASPGEGLEGQKVKILALAPQWPDPPRQGAAIRNLHILRYLASRHQVTLLTFTPEMGAIDRSGLSDLRHAEIFAPPARSAQARLRTLLSPREPDMAWRLRSCE